MTEPQDRPYVKIHVTYQYQHGPTMIEEDMLVHSVDMTREQASRLVTQLGAMIELNIPPEE